MFRKTYAFAGLLLAAGALVFVTPGLSQAQRHGGYHGGGYHGGGYHGGGYHGGGYHGGGYHGGGYYGGYGHGYGYGWGGFYPSIGLGIGYGAYPYRGGYYSGYGYYPSYGYNASPWIDSTYPPAGYGSLPDVVPADPNAYSYGAAPAGGTEPSYYAPAPASAPAAVTVTVPADAKVWFDGSATNATGPTRDFESPPLTPGQRYSYSVRARWMENGQEVTQSREVEVTAGSHARVDFTKSATR